MDSATPRPWIYDGFDVFSEPEAIRVIERGARPEDLILAVAAVNACHALNMAPADLGPNVRALVEALEELDLYLDFTTGFTGGEVCPQNPDKLNAACAKAVAALAPFPEVV